MGSFTDKNPNDSFTVGIASSNPCLSYVGETSREIFLSSTCTAVETINFHLTVTDSNSAGSAEALECDESFELFVRA